MNILKSQSLGVVVLPLVQVMADADLSWSDREKISAAIHQCHRQWTNMEKERQMINAQSANYQAGSLQGQIGQVFPNSPQ